MIECLKKSGMEIKDIRQFMEWCAQGSQTYPLRLELFVRQKAAVEQEMQRMGRVLDMLTFKCWYYEQAICDGNERRLQAMTPQDMPEEIRRAYEKRPQGKRREPVLQRAAVRGRSSRQSSAAEKTSQRVGGCPDVF